MQLHQLAQITSRSKKRMGRGLGSGKGKTGGRGMKGQKARGKIPLMFIGGTLPLYKKLPYRRGLGNPARFAKPVLVNLSQLSVFKAGSVVDLPGLIQSGLVVEKKAAKRGVKIVGGGEAVKGLVIKVPVSSAAAARIEKAGGRVVCA